MREPRDVLRTCIALLPGELQASNAFGIDWLGDWDSNRLAAGYRQRFWEFAATLGDWS